MELRKDSYTPEFYTEYRYDKPILLKGSMNGIQVTGLEHGKFRHLIDRRPGIDYLQRDVDIIDLLIQRINEDYEKEKANE